ncbi:hypothetical protein [Lysobacter sp. CA199]|uniref:hypothetical protein n=1 Tax=Lysobacter sp. CA199 TaxID=3455608 RepID=UPI003F8D8A51
MDKQQTLPAVAPPSPGDVIAAIYNERGDNSDSYEVANGAMATFWYGYEFDFAGKRYYTGFAYSTAEKYGKDKEEDFAAPDEQVTLSQATFERGADPAQPWTFYGAQPFLGEFGGYERGPGVDQARKAKTFATAGGGEILAVPASESINEGISAYYYEIFLRAPHEDEATRLGPWRYLSSVDAGGDNAAGCATDPADAKLLPPCVKSAGEIVFETIAGQDLPQISVALSGTQIAGPGKVGALDPNKPQHYRYDAKDQAYRPVATN